MSRAGLASRCALLVAALSLAPTGRAVAVEPPVERVTVILAPDASFEDLLAVPGVGNLARAGGAALMSSEVPHGDEGTGALVTLGAGARSAGPPPPVHIEPMASGEQRIVSWPDLIERNESRSVPGLLGSIIVDAGGTICGGDADGGLVAADRAGIFLPTRPASPCEVEVYRVERLGDLSGTLSRELAGWGSQRGLMLVVAPAPSHAMQQAGDELTPVVAATGGADDLLEPTGSSPRALASDTTHQTGVVSNEDIAPTILSSLGLPVPLEMKGHPMRVTPAAAPFDVHRRYRENLSVRGPAAAAAAVAMLGLLGFAAVIFFRRERASDRARAVARWALFATPSVATALQLAGRLPTQNAVTVAALLVAAATLVPWVCLRFRPRGVLRPPAVLGAIILAAFALEVMAGSGGMRFTLLGATSLDGGRFFGLHNVAIGLLLGAALFVAASLPTWLGTVTILATAALMGLPWTGSNLGAAVTLSFAGGLWAATGSRRPRWAKVLIWAGIAGGAMAATLLAHRYLAAVPTHGTRFIVVAGADPGSILSIFWSRLQTGVDLIILNPGGLPYLIATPVMLWIVTTSRGGLRPVFERFPIWRQALLVILWSCVVAYFFNDTGVAAVGLGFLMALIGTWYVPLALERGKMEDA